MCFFPIPNTYIDGIAYQRGIREFDCGSCPECLQKRSGQWALRCSYEAKLHTRNCMVTLTYDTHQHDKHGNIIRDRFGNPLENPVDLDRHVSKVHIQKFIKRLRKHFKSINIKYFCGAEYGSRTHRAHYHLILFGVDFTDRVFYKKSKRGNPIYTSPTLKKLWKYGICTIDSVNINSAIARYCSKYCAKQRGNDDTFNLFSQSIGLDGLLKDFNGKSYIVSGREFPVPRIVWEHFIMSRYSNVLSFSISNKYVNRNLDCIHPDDDFAYLQASISRENYRNFRDSLPIYQFYKKYWSDKIENVNRRRPSVYARIRALPETKYHFYKAQALQCLLYRELLFVPAPGSKRGFGRFYRENEYYFHGHHLPFSSCLNTASDTLNNPTLEYLYNHVLFSMIYLKKWRPSAPAQECYPWYPDIIRVPKCEFPDIFD